jgi:hypothetical protein
MSQMRKILAILLISIHLTGNTELGQLFRFPQLITHFFQHHRLDPSINFFEFIAMHYAGDDGTTADDDIDNQLPCHNPNHNTLAVVYSPMIKEIPSIEFSSRKTKEYNSRLQTGITSKHVQLILQPPRLG